MNVMLQAGAAAPAAAQGGSMMSSIIMIVMLFVVMYFFMIRPQRKQQKALEAFRNSLTAGQQVVTSGGIYGTVKEIINENGHSIVVLEIATGVKVKIDKSSVYADMSATTQQK